MLFNKTRLNSKSAQIKKLIYYVPYAKPKKIKEILTEQGIKASSEEIKSIRSQMRKYGIKLPNLGKKTTPIGPLTILYSTEAQIRRFIYHNQTMSSTEIARTLEKKGIKCSAKEIRQIRNKLRVMLKKYGETMEKSNNLKKIQEEILKNPWKKANYIRNKLQEQGIKVTRGYIYYVRLALINRGLVSAKPIKKYVIENGVVTSALD